MRLNKFVSSKGPRIAWLAMLVTLGMCSALGFSYVAELNRGHSTIETDLKFWAPELADVYSHKDWLRLSKLGRSFAVSPVKSLVFRDTSRIVFSLPQETDEAHCSNAERHVIKQYGAELGTLEVCQDPVLVLGRAVASPLFLVIAVSLFFIIGFAAIFPVIAARRGLAALVEYLSKWSASANTTNIPLLSSMSVSKRNSLEGKLQTLVQDLVRSRVESEKKALRAEIVRDVAHNLNSPIASLAIRLQKLEGVTPEARASINEGLSQLHSIVAKLKAETHLINERNQTQARLASAIPPKIEMLSFLIDSIISDKQSEKMSRTDVNLQFEFSSEGYGAFVTVHALDFRVVLSNLLNNAYEAIEGPGEINVRVQILGRRVRLEIQDTGHGISETIVNELFNEGVTHGKPNGSGRGLFHAKKILLTWSGDISIQSHIASGTTVTVNLPLAPQPAWFLPQIDLTEVKQVVVLDDDPSISHVWRMKFPQSEIESFTDPDTFKEWLAENRQILADDESRTLFLIDNQLGVSCPSGLDIIETQALAERAVLVTSDANQESIRKRVSFLGAKLLWKMEIGAIPIAKPADCIETMPGLEMQKTQDRSPGLFKNQ